MLHEGTARIDVDVSKNNGTPKSSILRGFSIINHPFWGTPIFGNIQVKPVGLSPLRAPDTIGLRVLRVFFFSDFVFCGLNHLPFDQQKIAATLWQTNTATEYPHFW